MSTSFEEAALRKAQARLAQALAIDAAEEAALADPEKAASEQIKGLGFALSPVTQRDRAASAKRIAKAQAKLDEAERRLAKARAKKGMPHDAAGSKSVQHHPRTAPRSLEELSVWESEVGEFSRDIPIF